MPENNDKINKRQEFLKDVRQVVKEELKMAFDESVVPKGYERCPVCSEVKKINVECPYCPKPEPEPEKKDDIDDLIG